MSELLLDRAGRRRSPATMPGFHAGRPPRNKGALRSFSWNSSLRRVDDQAGAAEVDEGDERLGSVEAEGAV